ncbi:hypothetical protein ACKVMT_09885 [Halobacteriales archaeon Cl-PHB]
MDRISALRNVEDALADFEDGDLTLPELEGEVRGILRTYATEFDDRGAYRASGDPAAEGLVVLASSRAAARDRLADRLEGDVRFEVEPLG